MNQFKLFVLVIFFAVAAASCLDSKTKRFSIAESKAYEASLFRQNCSICHGPEALGQTLDDGRVIPDLREGAFKYKTDDEIFRHISEGGNGMIPFRNQLTPREINLLVGMVQNELRKGER